MIEIAANASLQAELALVRERGARLHVIRPRVPLPLDPDFFLGRVDAATLIAMGYRDAAAHLDGPDAAGGVPAEAGATRMADPVPGVAFRERLEGGGWVLRLGWEIDDLDEFQREPRGTLVADATHPLLGARRPARSGRFEVRDGWVVAELRFGLQRLELRRRAGDWLLGHGGTRLHDEGQTLFRMRAPWRTLHARGVGSPGEGAQAVARFARWALRAAR
jgi:hypothetical protein